MGRKARGDQGSPSEPDAVPRPRRHPVTLAVGLLLVAGIIGAAGFAAWTLYSDYAWHSSAEDAATAVAEAVQSFSARDESPPEPVDAVSGTPADGQVAIDELPYADEVPPEVARIRITPGGALSVLTRSAALCAGVTLDMESTRKIVRGSFRCGEALPPPTPVALRATPFDEAVVLEWPQPPAPVEDYSVSFSVNDGASWTVVDDGVSAASQATVQQLANGREYLFRVAAVNLVGESAPATTRASPFTEPGPPTNVSAVGGFRAVISWTPPGDDGGRPITGYVVTGEPEGSCTAEADQTRCEISDLPAAPGYTFIVRAVNEAGAGTASNPATDPIAVYSAPGRAVALSASPGDGVVLLTWTSPLRDGNTPITDYTVEYRVAAQEEWTRFEHPPSPDTTIAVSGLANGTEYEFRVLAVNAVGVSEPPLSQVFETPATVPDPVPTLDAVAGNESMTLTWTAPVSDGGSPITDYAVQFRAAGGQWTTFDHLPTTAQTLDVTGLENGTKHAFRVAAVNRMGQSAWSPVALGTPVGPPGPVVDPESVGSLTAIELTWKPPENDGGRRILGYRVEYTLTTEQTWLRLPRVPPSETTATVEGLEPGESYDFRILAINAEGFGPSTQDGSGRPTLSGVIADETPPAPEGLTAVPGDGIVTLTWDESPAGKKSPIIAYTVTGDPAGTCIVKRLTCVVQRTHERDPVLVHGQRGEREHRRTRVARRHGGPARLQRGDGRCRHHVHASRAHLPRPHLHQRCDPHDHVGGGAVQRPRRRWRRRKRRGTRRNGRRRRRRRDHQRSTHDASPGRAQRRRRRRRSAGCPRRSVGTRHRRYRCPRGGRRTGPGGVLADRDVRHHREASHVRRHRHPDQWSWDRRSRHGRGRSGRQPRWQRHRRRELRDRPRAPRAGTGRRPSGHLRWLSAAADGAHQRARRRVDVGGAPLPVEVRGGGGLPGRPREGQRHERQARAPPPARATSCARAGRATSGSSSSPDSSRSGSERPWQSTTTRTALPRPHRARPPRRPSCASAAAGGPRSGTDGRSSGCADGTDGPGRVPTQVRP